MALRGNLRDFSLPDVFQLVTFSRKTGVLRITREGGAQGSVWFRDGDVFFASSNWHKELLGERLVRSQRITPQALKRALQLRGEEPETGRRLGQILVDEGYITDKVLEAFVQEQIQDTIFDLMRWDEGDFDFEAMPDVVDEDIGLVVSIENVVMEGSRRLEEWNRIRKKIPSMEVVFKMATAPGEGTFEISLKPTEWQLLLLIDSTRSVSDLASETGRTDFEVARVLYGLFSAGLLEFASDEEIEHNRAERASREAKLAVIEAERRKIEDVQKATTLERESALEAESQKRSAPEPGPQGATSTEAAVPSAPAEVPSFLGAGSAVPTDEDQAALEEFMGAILGHPAPEAAPEAVPVAVEPYTPSEEPAFMNVDAGASALGAREEEVPIEDLLGLTPQPLAEPPVTEEPVAEEPVPAEPPLEPFVAEEPFVVEAATEVESATETGRVEEPAPAPVGPPVTEMPLADDGAVVPPDVEAVLPEPVEDLDFERDLMALGLGELPGDLLEPVESQGAMPVEPSQPASEQIEAPAEPMSIQAEALEIDIEWAAELTDAVAEVSQAPAADVDEQPQPTGELEFVEVVDELDLDVQVEPSPQDEMDFSALIESLDVDADDLTELSSGTVEVAPPDSGFDEDLLRDDTPVSSGKVISTDAFLSDITMDDLGFSGGLTDELSALTGVQRKSAPRPQASVNRLPDEGSSVLKRDARVDKDTLLKIIDGIQNL